MVFAAVFAGGVGSRMGNYDTPKQYMLLGGKPIIVHTVERFFVHPEIDQILILCPKAWIGQTRDMLAKSIGKHEKVQVIEGGAQRNDTLENALTYIRENFPQSEDNVLVTHDAVRPFLTHRIISENIAAAREYGACDTVVPATDTIAHSTDGKCITTIPARGEMYQGQTPQSFLIGRLETVLASLTAQERDTLTDACKIFSIKNEPVYMVQGEMFNIKITYPYDLKVANALLEREMTDD